MRARARQWAVSLATLGYGRWRRRRARDDEQIAHRRERDEPDAGAAQQTPGEALAADEAERIVPAGPPDPRAEYLVVALLLVAALFAAGFVLTYAEFKPSKLPNQLLGVCIAAALAFLALALAVFGRRLIVTEELEEDYPEEHPDQQQAVVQIVRESGSRLTRRRLLLGAASATGAAIGLAGLTPVLSLGPLWDTTPLFSSPWYRGRRLVDSAGQLLLAAVIEQETFYTAFPEGANREDIASPIVLVRLQPAALKLPARRDTWAPLGIVAYSKICTHAGCAVALYRKPRFPVVEPEPALVCPCHYSTFNPATGATVIFGPAGRPLPQLPLMIDAGGYLRAAGNFSGPVGPAWWGTRSGKVT